MKQMEFRRLNDRHGAGNRVIHKKNPVFGPPFTPIPSFSGIRKVKKTFYEISAFNS